MTRQEAHYVVELVGQSHETNRTDLTNENVITVPVVDGPYESPETAHEHTNPGNQHSTHGYAVVTVLEENPDYIDNDNDESSEEWSMDSPCPHCGSDDIHVIRGREETYRTDDENNLSYDGLATGTVVAQTEAITAFCNDCDETLYEHPANTLLRTDTL